MARRRSSRAKLPSSAFAIPSKRLYPINTLARARSALSYSARPTTRGSYSTVRRAVLKKYPQLRANSGSSRPAKGSVTRSSRRGKARRG